MCPSEKKVIHFYNVDKPYGCFSNFWRSPITIGRKIWSTTEHYFQAMKFVGTESEELIRTIKTPMEAAQKGRDRSLPLRSDWLDVRVEVMRTALLAKFEQNEHFRNVLLSTGDCKLIEHTRNDSYWGDGGDGSGANMLGILLMELRDQQGTDSAFFLPPHLWNLDDREYLEGYEKWLAHLDAGARKEYVAYFLKN